MINSTTTPTRNMAKTTSHSQSIQTRPALARQRNSGLAWKSTLLTASVGLTLLGSTLLTRIEQANAAAEAARTAQSVAVVQVIQVLDAAKTARSAQVAAFQRAQAVQLATYSEPRTIIVRVPVSGSSAQPIVSGGGSGQFNGQPSGQPSQTNQSSQASFASAPAPAPAIVMPAMPTMPTAPVFQAPVTVTRKS